MTVDVYRQYFAADCVYMGIQRRAALVTLSADSENGWIRYEAAVTFFPHEEEEDYAVSYDAYYAKLLLEKEGRRSKKREEALLANLREVIDELCEEAGGTVYWDRPLRPESRG